MSAVLRGDEPHRYLSTAEVAAELGIAAKTVERWCRAGSVRIKPRRNGRAPYLVVRSEVERLKRERGCTHE